MKWKQSLREYFLFTRKERIGLLAVVILIIAIIFLPEFIHPTHSKVSSADTAWLNSIKRLEIKEPENNSRSESSDDSYSHQYDPIDNNNADRQLFYFDPNTADANSWRKLGLNEKTIHTIQNYLNKGGHFNKPEDLKRIYGLKADDYNQLAPFIRITSNDNDKTESYNPEKSLPEKQNNNDRQSRYSIIDINEADTLAFIALPGIGSKLALRIVTFREKLGGFYSVEQIKETFGLPDSTFQKIKQYLKLENISLKKININTCTVDELKAHPYIKWSIANPIIAYRSEHGLFQRLEDIKKIAVVTDELYNKIAPYLSLQ